MSPRGVVWARGSLRSVLEFLLFLSFGHALSVGLFVTFGRDSKQTTKRKRTKEEIEDPKPTEGAMSDKQTLNSPSEAFAGEDGPSESVLACRSSSVRF